MTSTNHPRDDDAIDVMSRVADVPDLPPRPAESHKGTFGSLLVVGGSESMIGAPMLAARAAYRSGVGLVQVAMPKSVLAPALAILPEAIGLNLIGDEDDPAHLAQAMEKASALVAGPGLGQEPQARPLLATIWSGEKPAVFDADALNLLAAEEGWPEDISAPLVLTPHPGEMKRLAKLIGWDEVPRDEQGRLEIASDAAGTFDCVVVLKGQRTIVCDPSRFYVNDTGDQTLAKAGSGDVLSGLIGSLLAQGMSPFDAAVAGVYYHGKAGEAAGRRWTRRGALAEDVADELPGVMPKD